MRRSLGALWRLPDRLRLKYDQIGDGEGLSKVGLKKDRIGDEFAGGLL